MEEKLQNGQPDHPRVATHPPLIFLGFMAAALLLGWVIPIANPWLVALRWTGGAALLGGFVLAWTALTAMVRARTSPDPHQPVTALVTDGPYRFTRNPIYLGFVHVYLGITLLAGTLWGVLLAPVLILTMNRLIIQAEETYLENKFGAKYTRYKASVRRWV